VAMWDGRTSHSSYGGGRDEVISIINAGVEAMTEEVGRGCKMDVDVVVDAEKREALCF
jgi:hypothetical protein